MWINIVAFMKKQLLYRLVAKILILVLLFSPLGQIRLRLFDVRSGLLSNQELAIGPKPVDAAWEFEARGMNVVNATNTAGNEVNVRHLMVIIQGC
jgi:hypothetical protein